MNEKDKFEIMVADILRERPASAETISVITGLPTNHVLMKLRRLENWKIVKPITKKEVIIWALTKD
jgi:predicted transcriptional regulator